MGRKQTTPRRESIDHKLKTWGQCTGQGALFDAPKKPSSSKNTSHQR